jgi:hypothetical protein
VVYLEIAKHSILSGCCLDRYGTTVELSDADVTMLKNSGACEDGRWLRKCHLLPGATGSETGADRASVGGGEGGTSLNAPDDDGDGQQMLSTHFFPP